MVDEAWICKNNQTKLNLTKHTKSEFTTTYKNLQVFREGIRKFWTESTEA